MPNFLFTRGSISITPDGRTEHVLEDTILEVSIPVAFDLAAAGAGRITTDPVRAPRPKEDEAEKTSRSKKVG